MKKCLLTALGVLFVITCIFGITQMAQSQQDSRYVVAVKDGISNPVAGAAVTWEFRDGTCYGVTDANGFAVTDHSPIGDTMYRVTVSKGNFEPVSQAFPVTVLRADIIVVPK